MRGSSSSAPIPTCEEPWTSWTARTSTAGRFASWKTSHAAVVRTLAAGLGLAADAVHVAGAAGAAVPVATPGLVLGLAPAASAAPGRNANLAPGPGAVPVPSPPPASPVLTRATGSLALAPTPESPAAAPQATSPVRAPTPASPVLRAGPRAGPRQSQTTTPAAPPRKSLWKRSPAVAPPWRMGRKKPPSLPLGRLRHRTTVVTRSRQPNDLPPGPRRAPSLALAPAPAPVPTPDQLPRPKIPPIVITHLTTAVPISKWFEIGCH